MKKSHIDFRDQIARNKRNSVFLILVVALILVGLVYVIGLAIGGVDVFVISIIAIVISLGYILVSYYNSGKIAVASVGAKKIRREGTYKDYYDLVEGLTLASGLPMPELYVMSSSQINAFASGRNPANAVICVTKGALEKLDRRELEAVLAHELGHIANYDIRYMTLVTVMVGMISIISQIFLRSLWFRSGGNDKSKAVFMLIGIALAILAPIVVFFVQMAISRKREYSADASAVKFTRYPDALVRALKKIQKDAQVGVTSEKRASKALAPLFITNPFKGMSSTHPPIEKRIAALESM